MNILSFMRTRDLSKLEAIQRAALLLIRRDGLPHVSMKKIADEAGVSPATLYIHYRDKEDMLGSLYLQGKDILDQRMFATVDEGSTIEAQVKALLRGYAFAQMEERDWVNLIRTIGQNPSLVAAEVHRRARESDFAQHIERLFNDAVRSRLLRDIELELAAALTLGAVEYLCDSLLREERPLTEGLANELVDGAWNAIRAQ
jgi:AcrR family transcriptional regulator